MKKLILSNDIEKIENILNDMSKKGYRFVGVTFNNYEFKQCEKDKYQYQVDYSINVNDSKYREYYNLLNELNIKIVCTYKRFRFLEKINDGTDFNLYTDYQSKLEGSKKNIVFNMIIALVSTILIFLTRDKNIPFLVSSFPFLEVAIFCLWNVLNRYKQLKKYKERSNL